MLALSSQIPSTKHQIPNKQQIQNDNRAKQFRDLAQSAFVCRLQYWHLSYVWVLEFGIETSEKQQTLPQRR
jgi:hypothetical protein